jgi:hypothetical protein
MKTLTEKEILSIDALVENFYKVVPPEWKTYCSLTSHITQASLRHFGIETVLLPCQVWVVAPQQNYIVGFLGKSVVPDKWNGHVVCAGENFIVDAALHHFNVDFGLTVPSIVAAAKFRVPTQVISRLDLDEPHHLWWHLPPVYDDIDLNIPHAPPELVSLYSRQLIERLSAIAGIGLVHQQPGSGLEVNLR